MKVVDLEQGSEQWLEFRKSVIGASELSIILGVSPWCTPHLLWSRKLGFSPPQGDNFAMKRGRDLEPFVRQLACEEIAKGLGKESITFDPLVCTHEKLEWAAASLDGYNQELDAVLEIKVPGLEDHQSAERGEIPEKYKSQVQWQMFVSGTSQAYYASYYSGNLALCHTEKDEEYIAKVLLPAAGEFMGYIKTMTEPPKAEDDFLQIVSDEFEEYARQWKSANEMLKLYQEKEKYFKNKLVSFTDDGNCKGYGITLKRIERDGSVDWKALYADLEKENKELSEKLAPEKYRKDSIGYWKISQDKD